MIEIICFIKAKFEFQVKMADIFRTFVSVDKIDWCYIMKKTNAIPNAHVKALIREMTKSMPRLFDPCPFSGHVELINVPPQEKVTNKFNFILPKL